MPHLTASYSYYQYLLVSIKTIYLALVYFFIANKVPIYIVIFAIFLQYVLVCAVLLLSGGRFLCLDCGM